MFNEKKCTCFVCGQLFENYNEMKTHITTAHDEGREFVICPLQRCGFPVRCLRSHFKLKHPNEKIPQDKQMKALIWKDFKDKKKPKVKKHFKEGFYESKKNNKKMHYRSGLECEYYKLLELMNDVASYHEEAFAINYMFEGTEHRYIPDILVQYKDGKKELWEVKPKYQMKLPKNQAKWAAAKNWCEARNIPFIVYTEKGLLDLQKRIRNQSRG